MKKIFSLLIIISIVAVGTGFALAPKESAFTPITTGIAMQYQINSNMPTIMAPTILLNNGVLQSENVAYIRAYDQPVYRLLDKQKNNMLRGIGGTILMIAAGATSYTALKAADHYVGRGGSDSAEGYLGVSFLLGSMATGITSGVGLVMALSGGIGYAINTVKLHKYNKKHQMETQN